MADSGRDERGEWTPAFPGQRPPFEPGHELTVKHSAYADVRLGPRVAELADEIRTVVPAYSIADDYVVRLLALSFARIEAAEEAIAVAEPGELERLRQDLRGWVNSARRLLNDLALTPMSRARLGLDIARAKGEGAAQYLRDKRAREQEAGDA